jgi:hypothetical protein
MTRARETADIIHKVLPDIPREETDILREGALQRYHQYGMGSCPSL